MFCAERAFFDRNIKLSSEIEIAGVGDVDAHTVSVLLFTIHEKRRGSYFRASCAVNKVHRRQAMYFVYTGEWKQATDPSVAKAIQPR